MRKLLSLLLLCLFVSSVNSGELSYYTNRVKVKHFEVVKTLKCRITYFHPNEPGYEYGHQVAWEEVKKAKQGRTVAVNPSKIPYGTKIYIPELHGVLDDGMFRAEDTGSAVVSLKAIPQRLRKEIKDVIDVFVESAKTMRLLERTMPKYMDVEILKEV